MFNAQCSILVQTERNQACLNCRGAAENHEVILNFSQVLQYTLLTILSNKVSGCRKFP
jgi:hypothetical protein